MLLARLLPRRLKVAAALCAVFSGGASLALQARINAELGKRVGPALVAALISFTVGLLAIALVLTVTRRWGTVSALRTGDRRLWWFSGGLGGAALVTTAAFAVPLIGVALFFVCQVAGQLAGGLFVDRAGIAPGGRRPITPPRLAGAALAMAAVALSRWGSALDLRPFVIVVVSVAGFLGAVQQAANGHIRRHAGDVLVAVLLNFVVGAVALLAVCAVRYGTHTLGKTAWPGQPLWLYAGGLIGVVFVAVSAAAVRLLGVLRLTLAVVAGQLFGAVLLDAFWGTPAARSAQLYAAVLLVLIAVAVAGQSRVAGLRGR